MFTRSAENEILQASALNIADASRETDVSLSTSAAVSGAITTTANSGLTSGGRNSGGMFDVMSTVDCFIAVSADPSGVTTTTGYPLLAGNVVPLWVPYGYKIGGITASGTGTLYLHRSKRV